MKTYTILSPSGNNITVGAESIYHAIQLVLAREKYKYDRQDYFKLNRSKLQEYEAKIKRFRK